MKKVSTKLLFGFLALSTLASMAGAISGTVAWYAYVTRATMSYSGTSVNSTKQLQIGIKSDVVVTFPEGVVVNDVPFEGGHYYFMNPGTSLPASVINAYLGAKGYATTTLEPVSSYTYSTGDSINLRNSPTANKPFDTRKAAELSKYVAIPFAFRVVESDLTTPTYSRNKPIFITDAAAQAASDGDGNINEAIRLFIDRKNGADFIFNPNSATNGQTKVTGILDISGDHLFDFVNEMSSPYYEQECLYGDYTLGVKEIVDGDEVRYTLDELYSGPSATTSGYVDANGSGIDNRRTTFTAKHYEGIKYLDLPTLISQGKIIPHYADYLGTNTVYPTVNADGLLAGDYAVCVTADTDDNEMRIGEFDMKIYIEGWDFNVIDDELSHMFNLGLTFEIN